ncbi:MAG: hypothetical protein RML99_09440 [Anaerolineae bacterium]|nr:hypothetical protein [Anaerolineae bacterium]
MLGDTVLNRDLDEFMTVPELKGNVLLRPSRAHQILYAAVLFVAALLGVTGLANLVAVFSSGDLSADATAKLGLGFLLLLVALGLLWRFSSPFVFAAAVTEHGLYWRNIFGWHEAPWDEVEFALVEPHSRFGGRAVHVKAGNQRMHFGWFDATDWYTFGPLESLPADEAKSLVHTIVARARLTHRSPGVWVNDRLDRPVEVSTGQFKW